MDKEVQGERTWTSAAQAIYGLLQYSNKKNDYSLADVMGLSGHAFRINIHPANVSPAGPTMFSPTELLQRGLNNMGFRVEQIHGFPTPAPPEKIKYAVEFAQESLDRGMPVIGWSLFIPEFGLIYGYDDDKQELYGRDPDGDGPIPYSKLNELAMRFVCMIKVHESYSVDALKSLVCALEMAIEHAEGRSPILSKDFKHGLAGYDAWIESFRNRSVDPFGNAYNAAVVSCAREYAAKWFASFPNKWTGSGTIERMLTQLGADAAHYFGLVAERMVSLREMFPFPQGGEPNNLMQADSAIQLLKESKEFESSGVQVMRKMLARLKQVGEKPTAGTKSQS